MFPTLQRNLLCGNCYFYVRCSTTILIALTNKNDSHRRLNQKQRITQKKLKFDYKSNSTIKTWKHKNQNTNTKKQLHSPQLECLSHHDWMPLGTRQIEKITSSRWKKTHSTQIIFAICLTQNGPNCRARSFKNQGPPPQLVGHASWVTHVYISCISAY